MWIGKRTAEDHLNDYWNALDRHAPLDELARLRARIAPELSATIDTARARFRRLRPDPAFSDRLEGESDERICCFHQRRRDPAAPAFQHPRNGQHQPLNPSARPVTGDARSPPRWPGAASSVWPRCWC